MEADFLRDYGIDLMERIGDMSWRRFAALARNLSPFGAAALRAGRLRENGQDGNDEGRAAAFFEEMRAGR